MKKELSSHFGWGKNFKRVGFYRIIDPKIKAAYLHEISLQTIGNPENEKEFGDTHNARKNHFVKEANKIASVKNPVTKRGAAVSLIIDQLMMTVVPTRYTAINIDPSGRC
jgi:hypothetical protein